MRKRVRILLFAAIVAAVVVPVGFALSLESHGADAADMQRLDATPRMPASHGPIVTTLGAAVIAWPQVPDGAKLFVIGSVLIGLAAAMRRTNRP